MTCNSCALALALVLLTACGGHAPTPVHLAAEAKRIANESIIVDTHIDVPYRLIDSDEDVSQATESGDFDYPRARSGGLNAAFMSIYTPAALEAEGTSRDKAEELIDLVENLVAASDGKFAIATSPADIRRHFEAGIVSLPMGMENGSPIEGELANLAHFHARGIRYITLAHSLSNHLSDSSYDDNRQWNGLSEFGAEAVREMNRLGIMVDISHVSDDAFWQVLEVSAAPVIASHSSARHFTPGWERNMSDEMIKALAEKGGVIMINFGSSFLTGEAMNWFEQMQAARKKYLDQNGFDEHGQEAEHFQKAYREDHPFPYADLDDLVAHFTHVIDLVGVAHVGVGSDFDGVGDSLPEGMKDVSHYPGLVQKLLGKGYGEADIEAILGGNLLRVWQAAEDYALEAARTHSGG